MANRETLIGLYRQVIKGKTLFIVGLFYVVIGS